MYRVGSLYPIQFDCPRCAYPPYGTQCEELADFEFLIIDNVRRNLWK